MDANVCVQGQLFTHEFQSSFQDCTSSTFADNMRLPVHRWFRFSAGFSAQWVQSILPKGAERASTNVFDPFAGSGTTLIACEQSDVQSYGVEAHPFVLRIARAKLLYRMDPDAYLRRVRLIQECASTKRPDIVQYADLVKRCYQDTSLERLDCLRRAWVDTNDGTPESDLTWLTLMAILRSTSHVGTAPWQYVLPRKTKTTVLEPFLAFQKQASGFYADMRLVGSRECPPATLLQSDARTCLGLPDASIDLVVTSPPYPNNYDYADATRLEMTFMGDVSGWSDLQTAVRQHLVRSCSQQVNSSTVNLEHILAAAELAPIREQLSVVCRGLEVVRETHGGKKNYHLMVACYFLDLALVWRALRRVCKAGAQVCFVIGDSAPYGVYVPVIDWMGALAMAAGFSNYTFEKTRDRNTKWKNRKHRVPLCEGRLWVLG